LRFIYDIQAYYITVLFLLKISCLLLTHLMICNKTRFMIWKIDLLIHDTRDGASLGPKLATAHPKNIFRIHPHFTKPNSLDSSLSNSLSLDTYKLLLVTPSYLPHALLTLPAFPLWFSRVSTLVLSLIFLLLLC
jgi:hypothetical protein